MLALLLAGCAGAEPPEAAVTEAEPEPDMEAVRAAREALGQPMVALADALLTATAAVDQARHEAPRGDEAVAAAAGLGEPLDALRQAAVAADASARALEGEDRIDRAADLVVTLAAAGVRAADAGAAQAAALRRLGEFDARMDDAVRSWETPGSQSERRAALGQLAVELEALAGQTAAEQPVPAGCPELRDARERWARLLAERSRALQEVARGATGEVYDARLAEFTAEPYGEDRLAADAATRPCWAEQSELARTAASVTTEVQALEALLQG